MQLDYAEAKKRIDKIKKTIEHHRKLYYELDNPDISDEEYDALERELIALEEQFSDLKTKDSPSNKVGGKASKGFEKIKHKVSQWSFSDIFDESEARKFDERVKRELSKDFGGNINPEYTAELKIDGLKIKMENYLVQPLEEMEKPEKMLQKM
jgi:DNA ligase (NAD+)